MQPGEPFSHAAARGLAGEGASTYGQQQVLCQAVAGLPKSFTPQHKGAKFHMACSAEELGVVAAKKAERLGASHTGDTHEQLQGPVTPRHARQLVSAVLALSIAYSGATADEVNKIIRQAVFVAGAGAAGSREETAISS